MDPAINHTVLDRQFNSVLFASQSPTILTGDDNGVVNVLKLSHQLENEDEFTNGIMSPYTNSAITDEGYRNWRQEQIQSLNDVITSKFTNNLATATAN